MKDSVLISIQGREYNIPFPNVGQYYRIEGLKQTLSNGNYNSMLATNSIAANNALDMIDIEAALVILSPELIKDLKVKNFSSLGIVDFKELKTEYIEKIVPFFKEINELLSR